MPKEIAAVATPKSLIGTLVLATSSARLEEFPTKTDPAVSARAPGDAILEST
ncbi:hypothetical protein ADIARSV_0872 [Arcticibacter svalbardensis MN12-7]|uniref:Uncharacterized protein n=1 Tax=Arcticibacter svalbardensis MN12-7 TaxID=1150600 RepID=R9H430_9SPHI|nr:hypothetical protein ADIARSV_0872 [Arcticibacter svalbardensis MN12-7]